MLTQSLNEARAAEVAALNRVTPVSSSNEERDLNSEDRKIDAETEAEIAANTVTLRELEAQLASIVEVGGLNNTRALEEAKQAHETLMQEAKQEAESRLSEALKEVRDEH